MALNDVNVALSNGSLGSPAANADGVACLVITGVGTAGLALSTPTVIYSLPEAEAKGITLAANPAGYPHIKEFYDGYRSITGKEVAELYIMLTAATQTLTDTCDVTVTAGAKKALDYAQGRVRLLGVARTPGGGYTPVVTGGIDADSLTAVAKAHDLGNTYAAKQQPIRTLVEARAFQLANVGNLVDLRTMSNNRAALVMLSSLNDGSASVGFVLGVAAALPIHRKISRVRNKAVPLSKVYIGDTEVTLGLGALDTINDKGYIIGRRFAGRAGYFINGDYMATAKSDPYALLCRGRVIDTAHRVVYDTYLEEIDEDVEVDKETGFWVDGYIEFMRTQMNTALKNYMGNSYSGTPDINFPPVDVIALEKTIVDLKITPKSYNSNILVRMGFNNPAQ